MKRTFLLVLALAAVAGCGGSDTSASTEPTVPDDPDEVVLTVTSEGGFLPVEMAVDRIPRYVVTADRSLYYQGPIPEIFPGPLLPSIRVTNLDEATWEEILRLVEEMGLPEIDEVIDESNRDVVADASTEVVTFYDEGGAHRYGAYALGLGQGEADTRRILLSEIIEILGEASLEADGDEYRPSRLQVIAGPAAPADPQFANVEPWPLDVAYADLEPLALDMRCTVVDGPAADELYEVFGAANQATRWDTGDVEVALRPRPLLPGEAGCELPPTMEGASPTTAPAPADG